MRSTSCATDRRIAAALLALVLGAAPAAASATPRAPAARATSAGAPAPGALAQRLCDALQALPAARKADCCATAPTGSLAGSCTVALERALRAGAVALEPTAVDRCVAESERRLAGCDWVTPYMPATPLGCRDLLRGRSVAGAACRSSLECEEGLSCRGAGPKTPGACLPPGPPGAVCGGAVDELASSLRQTDYELHHPQCAGFCLRGRCAAFVAPGEACSASEQCGPGSHCAAGRCARGPAPGLGEACAGATCAADLVCVAGRCAAPKAAGESCARSAECAASCLVPDGATVGTCGMKCSAWPPAGYTPPVATSATSSGPARAARR